ncbi:(2Fe-2S)-binding protein [Salicibibacter halophilus]|uniref:(2Fe-2S)-binding protein n=1 Tax=Salicibibacter halophilus TaxID=2502791 RepID=A0A514LM04_9BACI|nr:(2Fe-2S)-binding protein [Salicibibacter halophilus]QDI92894.1 (2Fe-2S)-binding protein [Salicibibacter halophilus]
MQDVMVCRCEEVYYSAIREAIEQGSVTSKEIKLQTRAGMGICQGRTCRPLIEQVLSMHTNEAIPDSSRMTHTNPIRPITLTDLANNTKRDK